MNNHYIHPYSKNVSVIRQPASEPKHVSVPNKHSFAQQLNETIQRSKKLTLSKHAKLRMEQRNIHISPNRWSQIEEKINEARTKGVNEPLVLLKEAALLVSAKNNTVITLMERKEAGSHIFTNIDGTIIME